MVSDMLPPVIANLPFWTHLRSAEPLRGGLSNESWLVTDDAGRHVARVGRDFPFHHVFRDNEIMAARAAHRLGFAPMVEYAVPGVMVSTYLAAKTYGPADVRKAALQIATLIRRFHHEMPMEVSGPARLFLPFHIIRDYGRTILGGESPFHEMVEGLVKIGNRLEQTQIPMPVIYSHNDLLPANFLETEDGKLWLIDFEYSAFSTPLFDLAGTASNAGMTEDEAESFVAAYFDQTPDAACLRAFDAMQVASLLRETMWSMVSHMHLSAPGADYEAYARQNLSAYENALDRFQTKHGTLR
jgi:thiamine kinase-like enzyme